MTNIRIEAEQMSLTGYTVEKSSISSGGNVINVGSGAGTAATQFAGVAGTYDLTVVYHDENDGQSSLAVVVDGVVVDSWILDEATDSTIATVSNRRNRILSGIVLNAKSKIEIKGVNHAGEYSRVDYLDIAPSVIAPVVMPPIIVPPSPLPSSTANNAVSTVGVGRIEAEQMTLSGGYKPEKSSISSGGQVINVGNGTGAAAAKFVGATDTYDLTVVYHDESDGQSALSVWVDGTKVDSWVLNEVTDSTIASVGNRRNRIISGVALNLNSVVEIRGASDGGEYSRVDYLDIAKSNAALPVVATPPIVTPATAPSPVVLALSTPTSTTGVGRIEAEQMTLTGYVSENSSISSGGKVINVGNGSGTAATRFTGAAGNYDLKMVYHDENDGASSLAVKVDGVVVDSLVLNEATDSAIASSGNRRERMISVSLNTNSVIEIAGTYDQKEYSRVDYIDIVAKKTMPPVIPPGVPSNVSSTTGVGIIEAEKMTLTGYVPENSSISSGKQVINVGNGSGTAATKFTGAAGSYDLKVVYHDENDGKSQLSVVVDGVRLDSWVLDEATDSAIATIGNRRERILTGVALSPNSVIEIKGSYDQKEYSRVDYLKIEPAGSTPPGGSSKLRVMPLGDSNTKGEGTPGGYRTQFWQRAVQDGVAIDFIGDRNDGGPSSLGDKDHEGWGGKDIPWMTNWVKQGNLAAQNPDVVLFMMGTNDANTDGRVKASDILNRLSTFIDVATRAVPKAYLFISSILPLDTPRGTATESSIAKQFNSLIPGLVKQKANQGKRVLYVNAGGSLNVGDINGDNSLTNDANDGLHATAAGYDKLGNAWYNAVSQSSVWHNAVQKMSGSASMIAPQSASLVASADQASVQAAGKERDNLLEGGSGFNELKGTGGADTFVYNSLGDGVDSIIDFGNNDMLRISASGFGGGLTAGDTLDDATYSIGKDPHPSSGVGTFLYSTANQMLSFDVDGNGSGSAIDIAMFSNGFIPRANQFEIVA